MIELDGKTQHLYRDDDRKLLDCMVEPHAQRTNGEQPMTEDPIVEEVHRIREAIAGRFNNDLQAIADDAKRRQAESARDTVALPPQRMASPAPDGGGGAERRAG
jgi:hypothetical protein